MGVGAWGRSRLTGPVLPRFVVEASRVWGVLLGPVVSVSKGRVILSAGRVTGVVVGNLGTVGRAGGRGDPVVARAR